MQEYNERLLEITQSNVNAMFEFLRGIAAAKSPSEFIAAATEHASRRVTIKGEDIMLGAAEIQAVAMMLHELVTNAAKYGSLSVPNGRACVTWQRQSSDAGAKLVFEWRELGGPRVVAAVPSGYGTNLIRNLIPHELGGAVDLAFAPDGVSCKIEVPLEQI